MSYANRSIAFYAATDVDLEFAVTDDAGTPVGSIAGSTFAFKLVALEDGTDEPGAGATAALTKLSSTSGHFDLDEVTMTATVKIVPADTASLLGRHYYELEETRSGGAVAVIATGVAQIRPNV